jgi:hypothetical protein
MKPVESGRDGTQDGEAGQDGSNGRPWLRHVRRAESSGVVFLSRKPVQSDFASVAMVADGNAVLGYRSS